MMEINHLTAFRVAHVGAEYIRFSSDDWWQLFGGSYEQVADGFAAELERLFRPVVEHYASVSGEYDLALL